MSRAADLARIAAGLDRASDILAGFTSGAVDHRSKGDRSPVTEADMRIDEALRATLPQPGEGWLSEETADDPARLGCERVWVVDPIDGTQEFIDGIPEWCVSIALVERGRAVAGGIFSPADGRRVIGSRETGVTSNGQPCRLARRQDLAGCLVLSSRSETRRGEWERFREAPFTIRPTGSVAYKLGRVAAGLADATWTLVPKHEWDVAAGAALVRAAGGDVCTLAGEEPVFNRPDPVFDGLIAAAAGLADPIRDLIGRTAKR